MIEVDRFLDRVPGPQYKCFDFAREVWQISFGVDVGYSLHSLTVALSERQIKPSELRAFEKLKQPEEPCFVTMQRGRTVPHIGIWTQGRVLHLAPTGAQYVPLFVAARRYPRVGFYR